MATAPEAFESPKLRRWWPTAIARELLVVELELSRFQRRSRSSSLLRRWFALGLVAVTVAVAAVRWVVADEMERRVWKFVVAAGRGSLCLVWTLVAVERVIVVVVRLGVMAARERVCAAGAGAGAACRGGVITGLLGRETAGGGEAGRDELIEARV